MGSWLVAILGILAPRFTFATGGALLTAAGTVVLALVIDANDHARWVWEGKRTQLGLWAFFLLLTGAIACVVFRKQERDARVAFSHHHYLKEQGVSLDHSGNSNGAGRASAEPFRLTNLQQWWTAQ